MLSWKAWVVTAFPTGTLLPNFIGLGEPIQHDIQISQFHKADIIPSFSPFIDGKSIEVRIWSQKEYERPRGLQHSMHTVCYCRSSSSHPPPLACWYWITNNVKQETCPYWSLPRPRSVVPTPSVTRPLLSLSFVTLRQSGYALGGKNVFEWWLLLACLFL